MRISDWSSDVCSSDLDDRDLLARLRPLADVGGDPREPVAPHRARRIDEQRRSDLDDQARAGGGREKRHVAADSARGAARPCEYRGSESRNFLSKDKKAPARALSWPPFSFRKWDVGWKA